MIDLKDIEGIYLYKGNTDMRMGIFSLSALAQTIIPVDVDNEVVTFKINDVVFSIEKKNEKLIELIVRTSLNV